MSRRLPRAGASTQLLAAVALIGAVLAAAPSAAAPSIESLRVERVAGRLQVSFDVEGAFTERALERLEAGLPLVFRHQIELTAKRAVPLWFPRVVARASVTNRAEYDSISRLYRLTRRIDVVRTGEQEWRFAARQYQSIGRGEYGLDLLAPPEIR